ncbi:undecaprenyldiphospho-muramoylpentapeptide beta-N-acetylglucosaminyltransferase [Rhodohalobacter halophilus]|uniref:undecaprenyldiphospho-muramoylpentapeptide beta-N-acetylglucosaminyltransferase n=1 Tax=Rhodohalobacter halophilus TaxID=1812810 RepID=UPI000A040A56|nr:undecaprenyldiphospho-muramoylpentapeptide beta-N-acetylglucosaminyltransferase [Rhodohalobacter halophilus]
MTTVQKNISSTDTRSVAAEPIRVLLAAGGTGGHVYPAIAIADAVRMIQQQADILFVGTRDRMEWQAVPKSGYDIKSVWISGFHRRLTPQNLLFPFKLLTSIIQSYSIIRSFKPDIMVACGGFAAGPVGWVAAKLGVPIVLQEQNSYPGVTNRLLAKHAVTIFTAFEGAKQYLPADKIKLSGNPVRGELTTSDRQDALTSFDFDESAPVLLILGGSGGALALNNIMKEKLDELHDGAGLQIIWQCGKRYFSDLKKEIDSDDYPNLRLMEYIDDMPAAYGAADLVVTRAGAGTCSELMILGQPAILVPSPNVAGDHQAKNAASMVEAGAAVLLPEIELEKRFTTEVTALINDSGQLKKMSDAMISLAKPHAANTIAEEIFNIVQKQEV